MKVGDLVRMNPQPQPGTLMVEGDWIGVIVGFIIDDYHPRAPDRRYAVVFWNEQYPEEEEYLDQIEVINA